MSRLYKINKQYIKFKKRSDNFILNIFLRKFIKEGFYFKAHKIIQKTFNIIRQKEKKNSYLVFLIALYNISPKIKVIIEKNSLNKKVTYKKQVIPSFFSLLWGINILLSSYKKNKGFSIELKLSNEIIQSFYKKSNSVSKKYEIEKNNIKKTIQDFTQKKKLKF